jgi:hypothetical protein
MEIFGVDLERGEVVLVCGDRFPVKSWFDPRGEECDRRDAALCIFYGPGGLSFALDLRESLTPPHRRH